MSAASSGPGFSAGPGISGTGLAVSNRQPAGHPGIDSGAAMGARVNAARMGLQNEFPSAAFGGNQRDGNAQLGQTAPLSAGMRVVDGVDQANLARQRGYDVDTPQVAVPRDSQGPGRERLALQQAVREAAATNGVQVTRTAPITEEEIQYTKNIADAAELAKFDDWVDSWVNPRNPGQLKFLMQVYPNYVERKLQQTASDHKYAMQSELIDRFGVNTFDDMMFLYHRDQGNISGPTLMRNAPPELDASYAAGLFSPFARLPDPAKANTLKLPFSSAKFGATGEMVVDRSDANRPMNTGTDLASRAASLYQGTATETPTWPGDGGTGWNQVRAAVAGAIGGRRQRQ